MHEIPIATAECGVHVLECFECRHVNAVLSNVK